MDNSDEQCDIGAYFKTAGPLLIPLAANPGRSGDRQIQLLEPIFSTESAYVARARDSKHGIIAVKFARHSAIKKETKILRALTDAGVHGIARVHGYCYVDPFHGIAMEFYRTCVAGLVSSNGAMQLKEVAALGKDMISTLQSVHKLGIIHGDVKPENIVTTTSQSFYLVDWGSAGYKSDLDILAGTPAFMSLRVLKGRLNYERDDLESLLYTLLYAAYGRVPWVLDEARDESDFVLMARERQAFRVEQISSLCSDVLQRFLNICRFNGSRINDSDYEHLTALLDSLL